MPVTRAGTGRENGAQPIPALPRAIRQTLLYADLFDYPLTLAQLTRYLIGATGTEEAVAAALHSDPTLQQAIGQAGARYFLAGREALVDVRTRRAAVSARVWPRARRYALLVGRLPFVRMVAVTGALAMDNVGRLVDIDLLVVAAPGRVWICRRWLIGLVRLARLLGDELCPNYIVDTTRLAMDQRDLYTAHELLQMVPLAGYTVYEQLLAANAWTAAYLPNAAPRPAPPARRDALGRGLQALLEAPLRLPVWAGWEWAELRRMQRKLRASRSAHPEIVFTPHQCKGHVGAYRTSVLDRFTQRLAEMPD